MLYNGGLNYSVIGGGHYNRVKAPLNVICGGDSNLIDYDNFQSVGSFIGGGHQNLIDPGSFLNVIVGGINNHQGGAISFIGGGQLNYIFDDCAYGVIVGGRKNYIGNQSHQPAGQAESLSFIGGGDTNTINSKWGVIGGGLLNHIATSTNFSVITGGDSNLISNNVNNGTIGGGHSNVIIEATANDGSGKFATIPGGDSLWAQSYGQTVVGVFNNKRGGSTASNFTSITSPNALMSDRAFDPMFVVGNGAPNSRSNAFEISNNGHSVVFDQSLSGGATPGLTQYRQAIKGATCTDNIIDAWAHMKWNSTGIGTGNRTVLADYGVTSITRTGPGVYAVALNIKDVSGATYTLGELAVTVTMCDDGSEQSNATCTIPVVVLPVVKNNTFTINIFTSGGCSAIDHSFMFHVTGR